MNSSSRSIHRLHKFHNNSDRLVPGIGRATESFRYIQNCQTVSPQASAPKPKQQQVVRYRCSGQYYRFSGPRTLTNEEKETMVQEKAMMQKLFELLEPDPDSAPKIMTASVESDDNDENFECQCEAESEFDCVCGYDDEDDEEEEEEEDGSVGIVSLAGSSEEEHCASRKRLFGEITPEHQAAQDDGTTTPTEKSVVEALRELYHPGRMVRRRLASDDSTSESTLESHEPKTRGSEDPGAVVVTPTNDRVSVISLPEKSPVLEQHQTTIISGSDDDTDNLLLDGTGYHNYNYNDDGCCYDLDLEITELFSEDFALEWDGSEDGEILDQENHKNRINDYGDDIDEAKIGTAIALDTTAISSIDTIDFPSIDSVNDHDVFTEKKELSRRKRTYADSFGE